MDEADAPRCETGRAIVLDPVALAAACLGFDRARPGDSARRTWRYPQLVAAASLAVAAALAAAQMPTLAFGVLHFAAVSFFAATILWRLTAAASAAPLHSPLAEPGPIYTILCPLYREANVVVELVAALARLDYPRHKLDVKLLVEQDDAATLAAACLAATNAPHIEVVVAPAAAPRTKPKALNAGLARARGEYVVVYDAEDRPHPQQLRAALAAFQTADSRLACVQAPLAVYNCEDSWIARQFAAEYAIQFTQALPLLARLGLPLPLGGTSNHFRTEALRATGGWDPFNVTEDADLGYRLARDGYRCGVIAPPTWEEAPISFKAWFKQRTRWLKGHMQTWLVLMRAPIQCARQMGWPAFASMHLVLGGGIAAALVHAPLACVLAIAALSPEHLLSPADFALALFGYAVAMFAALASGRDDRNHARAALTMPLYWPLASLAAYWALFELIFRPHYWSKTEHGLATLSAHSIPANSAHIAVTSASL